MNEKSLFLQIREIENLIQYITLVNHEVKDINNHINENIEYLRRNDLPMEIADKLQEEFLEVNDKMEELIRFQSNDSISYLEDVLTYLKRI